MSIALNFFGEAYQYRVCEVPKQLIDKVYKGNSTSYSDCLITIEGIYKYSILAILVGPY